jgi:hypothetical protein
MNESRPMSAASKQELIYEHHKREFGELAKLSLALEKLIKENKTALANQDFLNLFEETLLVIYEEYFDHEVFLKSYKRTKRAKPGPSPGLIAVNLTVIYVLEKLKGKVYLRNDFGQYLFNDYDGLPSVFFEKKFTYRNLNDRQWSKNLIAEGWKKYFSAIKKIDNAINRELARAKIEKKFNEWKKKHRIKPGHKLRGVRRRFLRVLSAFGKNKL